MLGLIIYDVLKSSMQKSKYKLYNPILEFL